MRGLQMNRCWMKYLILPVVFLWAATMRGQFEIDDINAALQPKILPTAVAQFQIKEYLTAHVTPPLQVPMNSQEWTSQAAQLRRHLLQDVIFHGWPKDWVDAAPKFEETGVIETGAGYRIRKLRYEILPGFDSVALLYEPEHINGKIPAILNLHGHVGPPGKAVEFKQKRCITYAKHGIMALSLEWFGFGELGQRGNEHWFSGDLDLVGANGVGAFYLEMRKGLDYLYDNPNVDRSRIGVRASREAVGKQSC